MENIADDIVLESQLIVLALAAGINDATTFPDYHIFVSNQTGNTALLAVGALGISKETVDLPNVAFSLGLFIVGGLLFGQIGDRIGRRRRAWLLASNAAQTAITFVATALYHWLPNTDDAQPNAWAVISLLAFASGGQVAMARTVNMPQIPTAMVTSAYIDFLVDPDLFHRGNRPRNRRFFFVVSLVIGSFIGASAYAYVGAALSLLLNGICKAFVCLSFLFNKSLELEAMNANGEGPTIQENDPT